MILLLVCLCLYLAYHWRHGDRHFHVTLVCLSLFSLPMAVDLELVGGFSSTWTGGLYLTLSDLFLLPVLATLPQRRPPAHASPTRGLTRLLIALLLLAAASITRSVTGQTSCFALLELAKTVFLYYFLITWLGLNRIEIMTIVSAFVFMLLFQGVCGCLQYLLSIDTIIQTGKQIERQFSLSNPEVMRASGTLGRPNGYAFLLSPLLCITVAAAMSSASLLHRKWLVAALGAGAAGLVFSLSRGGWLAFSLSLLFLLLSAVRQKLIRGVTLVKILALALLALSLVLPVLQDRIVSDDQKSASDRIEFAWTALNMIRENPLLGVGINTYYQHVQHYLPDDFQGAYVHAVHNQYLLFASEIGLPAAVVYLLLILSAVRISLRSATRASGDLGFIALGLAAAVLATAIHMNFEYVTNRNLMGFFFLLLALISSIKAATRPPSPPPAPAQNGTACPLPI